MTAAERLRERIARRPIAVAPGIYDGLSARLAADAGFDCLYLSGASIAYTRFGRPDFGLVAMNEVAESIAAVREIIDLPLIVDADTGFGNALNVMRTVALFERVGASAIQIEDQTTPKRCGHLEGKALVSTGEMVGKINAALDARRDSDTMIIARTDAIAVEGFDAALDRAAHYVEAGCDILFVEAPRSETELEAIVSRFKNHVPLLVNLVEGGQTPTVTTDRLEALGFSIVIFPGGLVRAFAWMAQRYFDSLRKHGSTGPYADRMFDLTELNRILRTDDLTALGQKYSAQDGETVDE